MISALTGKLPFSNVMMHGVVCDGRGKKMSKSLGNVVDPLNVINGRTLQELIEDLKLSGLGLMSDKELQNALTTLKTTFPSGIPKCGTDALRFSLMHNDPTSHQLNVDVKFISTCAAFCNKIWQASRFFLLSHERLHDSGDNNVSKVTKSCTVDWLISNYNLLRTEDKWILSRFATTVKEVNMNFESRDFHLAARSLRLFLYTNLCDVYVETSKPFLIDISNQEFKIKYTVMKVCLLNSLKLLHPIMPYITEELYQRILNGTTDQSKVLNQSIMTTKYPNFVDWEYFISKNVFYISISTFLNGVIDLT